jgi:hypothetical protein
LKLKKIFRVNLNFNFLKKYLALKNFFFVILKALENLCEIIKLNFKFLINFFSEFLIKILLNRVYLLHLEIFKKSFVNNNLIFCKINFENVENGFIRNYLLVLDSGFIFCRDLIELINFEIFKFSLIWLNSL